MLTSFPEILKQRFAGRLSEGEKRVCTGFRESLRAALTGQMSFRRAVASLWSSLSILREFHYDVEEAIASGMFDAAIQKENSTSRDKEPIPAPLSGAEKAFLEDADGLIDWATRNGVSFSVVLLALGHDLAELSRDDFQIEKTLGPGRRVMPKVTGWASRNIGPVGEADESA